MQLLTYPSRFSSALLQDQIDTFMTHFNAMQLCLEKIYASSLSNALMLIDMTAQITKIQPDCAAENVHFWEGLREAGSLFLQGDS